MKQICVFIYISASNKSHIINLEAGNYDEFQLQKKAAVSFQSLYHLGCAEQLFQKVVNKKKIFLGPLVSSFKVFHKRTLDLLNSPVCEPILLMVQMSS